MALPTAAAVPAAADLALSLTVSFRCSRASRVPTAPPTAEAVLPTWLG